MIYIYTLCGLDFTMSRKPDNLVCEFALDLFNFLLFIWVLHLPLFCSLLWVELCMFFFFFHRPAANPNNLVCKFFVCSFSVFYDGDVNTWFLCFCITLTFVRCIDKLCIPSAWQYGWLSPTEFGKAKKLWVSIIQYLIILIEKVPKFVIPY